MGEIDWAAEFRTVISCAQCDVVTCQNMLRDEGGNVPQPGYIGASYFGKRVFLVGQNPGISTKLFANEDRSYTQALRNVRDQSVVDSWQVLQETLQRFVPQWPVSGKYFPLVECDLTYDEIAYCNLVRCRTIGNAAPTMSMISNCGRVHFTHWLDMLKPKAVVFIGKWAMANGANYVKQRCIPFDYIDRNRSLNKEKILENRRRVATFVKNVTS